MSESVCSCRDGFNMSLLVSSSRREERRVWISDFLFGDLKLLLWNTSFNRSFRVPPFICNPDWPWNFG